MTLVDANILVYLYNQSAPQHQAIRNWIDDLRREGDWIGIPWVSLWAFVRVMTNSRLLPRPFTVKEAFVTIRDWLSTPNVIVVEPGRRHAEILEELIAKAQAIGPLVTDAILAALAIEQGATLASTDRGFSRFPNLHWINPLDVN